MSTQLLRIVRERPNLLPWYSVEILEDDGETWSYIGAHPRCFGLISFTYWGARFTLWRFKRALRSNERHRVVYRTSVPVC